MAATGLTPKPLALSLGPPALALAAALAVLMPRSASASETAVERLASQTHFHGIAVDPEDASRLYLATHHGLYVVRPDGASERVSDRRDDFMGFTPHPTDPARLYASGHPAGGGNMGVIGSTDGGRSWRKLADGIDGPVDFHLMDVSKADPRVLYGVHRGLQKSADGGRSWTRAGPAPGGLIDLAASSRHPDTLYAATREGLLRSTDGGKSWRMAHTLRRPATMVHVARDGQVYAFVIGTGLIRAAETDLRWRVAGDGFGDDYVVHLAVASGDPARLYVVTIDPATRAQAVLVSRDGGLRWARLGAVADGKR